MTTKYQYYKNEGNDASSAVVTKEAETRIFIFNPRKKLDQLIRQRGKVSLSAYELKLAA